MASSPDNHNETSFSPDQALVLRDLARHGSVDEASIYGYDASPQMGVSHNFSDMDDDPAVLLERLARFEHPGSGGDNTLPSTDHFASLLQAATTADRQEAAQNRLTQNRETAKLSGDVAVYDPRKRRRTSDHGEHDDKSDREGTLEDSSEHSDEGAGVHNYRNSPSIEHQARVVGVNSTAAMFRKPSTMSEKYSRKPVAQMFAALELKPEQFVKLQAAAKNFMLDESHPERSDTVGQGRKAETDMAKLMLFACGKSFLEDEGWGERCFGPDAEGYDTRNLKWPLMKNKIITLVVPLLRRMVTNERQRLYASRNRRDKAKAPGTIDTIDPHLHTQQIAKYTVNIMDGDRRAKPQFNLTPAHCSGYSSVIEHVKAVLENRRSFIFHVLTPKGLLRVTDEASWRSALKSINKVEWMDGEVKCVVQIGD